MAKGLRSKWKRKMRAIKREKNAPKELKKLKIILGLQADDNPRKRRYKFDDLRELITKPGVNQATGTTFDLRFVPSKDVAPMEAASENKEEQPAKKEDNGMEVEADKDNVEYVENDITILRHPEAESDDDEEIQKNWRTGGPH
ncbi:uncharacterized protein [Amphiura filiformis]|uniref:uncharacterized protein n=1 Tax=Amphiura filiformis TaxID=82378 RepID=UPI003B2138A4